MFSILTTFVLALIGAGVLYFVNQSKQSFDKNEVTTVFPLRKYAVLPFILPLVVAIFESITIVPAGMRGVQVTFGNVNPVPLDNGMHLVNPVSSVKNINIQLQRATMEAASAGTKDMQQVHTDIVINYRLNADKVATIYKDFGLDLVSKVLAPSLNEAFKSVTGHYTSEELITKRDEVSAGILEHVRNKLAQFDISVDSVSLVNFGFSAEYQKAIEAKVIATQMKQKAEQDLERIKVEAQSRIAQAEGEAKAISIQASAIQNQGGAAYVQLRAIEKWDGNLPNVMSGTVPFINVGK